MLNRSASLAMSTSVLEALPGKLDIKYTHLVFSYIRGLSVILQAQQIKHQQLTVLGCFQNKERANNNVKKNFIFYSMLHIFNK